MYFDAAVVFVTNSSLFFQIGCGHIVGITATTSTKTDNLIFSDQTIGLVEVLATYQSFQTKMAMISRSRRKEAVMPHPPQFYHFQIVKHFQTLAIPSFLTKNKKSPSLLYSYGNTGCEVFKLGVQN